MSEPDPEEDRSGDPVDRDRRRMVETQLKRRGIRDPRVLQAFAEVPRHRFVPASAAPFAYEDHPLSIGHGQTISQPYMVAIMTQELALQGGEKVLEVGTGSGYQAAILHALGARVFTVERLKSLSDATKALFAEMGIEDVRFRVGDGTLGWPEEAPFDRIIVTAGSPDVPPTLQDQLAEGGVLAIPVGELYWQQLTVLTRRGDGFEKRTVCPCVFVKLRGKEGWPE
ncbi:MAG: protein-L-isoaspartate(D-aspartate) O-methyltransferase [Planctomycetota bacterium]